MLVNRPCSGRRGCKNSLVEKEVYEKMDFYTASVLWIFSAIGLIAFNLVNGLDLVGNVIMDVCIAITVIGTLAYKRVYENMVSEPANA